MSMRLLKSSEIQKNRSLTTILACIVQLINEKEKDMACNSTEKVTDPIILGDDFNLAFKLVFFDENDNEVKPAQYKEISTFSVERDASRQQ